MTNKTDRPSWSWAGTAALAAGAGLFAAAAVRKARQIELRDQVVAITGGGRGLGLAIARRFAARGCRLSICGRDGEVIDRAVAEFRRQGVDAFGMACDPSDAGQAKDFITQTIATFGRIDVLVNNAGQCFVGPAVELAAADMEYALRHIFWVQFHPTMAALPHLRRRGRGRIVNVTSIGGKVPTPHQAAYNAAKHAAAGWTETLAVEVAKENIRVSNVTPPPLDNGAPLHVHFNGDRDAEFEWFARTLTSPTRATDADRAARAVVDAAEFGDAQRAVSPQSWLMQRAHGLMPNVTTALLALVDKTLPRSPASPGETSPMRLGVEVVAESASPRVRALAAAVREDESRYLPRP